MWDSHGAPLLGEPRETVIERAERCKEWSERRFMLHSTGLETKAQSMLLHWMVEHAGTPCRGTAVAESERAYGRWR